MKIRSKTGIVLFLVIAAFIGLLQWQISRMLIKEYKRVEADFVDRNIDRVVKTFYTEIDRLVETTQDYASWDDSYQFIDDRNQEYLDSNFIDTNLTALKLNFALIMNNDGEVAYARMYDWENEEPVEIPNNFLQRFTAPGAIYHFTKDDESRSGFERIGDGYYLVAARPIITSERTGPPKGTLLMSRKLNDNYVQLLVSRVSLEMSISDPAKFHGTSEYVVEIGGEKKPFATNIDVLGEGDLSISILFKDLQDKPLFVITIDYPRDIYVNGMEQLRIFNIALICLGLLFIIAVIATNNVVVIEPILKLSSAVHDVKQRKKCPKQFRFKGGDEISSLAETVFETFLALNLSEDKLKESLGHIEAERRKLQIILQSIGDAVFVLNKNGKIVLVNEMLCAYSGYKESELNKKAYTTRVKFLLEKEKTDVTREIESVFTKGEFYEMKKPTVLIKKDGSELPVDYSVAVIRNAMGKIAGCVCVIRDVTKERVIDKAKSEFVSIASHQLRTPLTGIKWMIELLMKNTSNFSPDQKEYLGNVQISNERMIKLVADLLNISRMETGNKFVLEKTVVDVKDLMEEVVKSQMILADQRKVKITLPEKWPDSREVSVDRQKFFEVFTNIVNNAVKYTYPDTVVNVDCKADEEALTVIVKDSGIGIPKEQQARMFEKFFRADNAVATQAVGTGLGLYAVKGITEAHGGKVWFESELNKGTTFFCQLPLSKPMQKPAV